MSVKKEHDITLELMLQASQKLADFSAGYDLHKFLRPYVERDLKVIYGSR